MNSTVRLSAPTNVCLCVTSQCNLNCRHCLAKSERTAGDLSAADISRIIRELAAAKVFFVSLFGGEPFVRGDILEIIEELSAYPIGISINTNGTLIDDRRAKDLCGYGISFVVSLDGSSAAIVDKIRGGGAFHRVMRGLNALRNHGHKVLISTTVMSHNHADLFELAALGKRIGASGVRFNNLFYINNAECYCDDISPTPEQNRELYRISKDLKEQYGSFVSGSLLQTMDLIRIVSQDDSPASVGGGPIPVPPCGAGVEKCAIRPDGQVLPCEVLWNTAAGSVLDRPFRRIWEQSPVLETFRTTLSLTENEIGECMACRYVSICYTGHRCMPYHSAGGLKNRDLFCIRKWMPRD